MSNVRRTFRVSNSHRLSGEIANEDPSPYLAHSPTFLLFLRQRAIALCDGAMEIRRDVE